MSKKLTAFVMSVVMLAYIACPGAVFAEESEAMYENVIETEDVVSSAAANVIDLGNSYDTVYVSTESELRELEGVSNSYIYLLNDITLTSEWTPIAISNCVFEGNGYSISNMKITDSSFANANAIDVGLFARSEFDKISYINNLSLKNIDINITSTTYMYVVIPLGGASNNCYVSGNISVDCADTPIYVYGIYTGYNCRANLDIDVDALNMESTKVYGMYNCDDSTGDIDINAAFSVADYDYDYGYADVVCCYGMYDCYNSTASGSISVNANRGCTIASIYSGSGNYYTGDIDVFGIGSAYNSNDDLNDDIDIDVVSLYYAEKSTYKGDISVKFADGSNEDSLSADAIRYSTDCKFYGDTKVEGINAYYISASCAKYNCENCYIEGSITTKATGTSTYIEPLYGCNNCFYKGNITANSDDDCYIYIEQSAENCFVNGNVTVNGEHSSFRIMDGASDCYYTGDIYAKTSDGGGISIEGDATDYVNGNIKIKSTKSIKNSLTSGYTIENNGSNYSGVMSVVLNGKTYSDAGTLYYSEDEGIHTEISSYAVDSDSYYTRYMCGSYHLFFAPVDIEIGGESCRQISYIDYGTSGVSSKNWQPKDSDNEDDGEYVIQVLDQNTEEPLSNVKLYADGASYTTNSNGIVKLSSKTGYIGEVLVLKENVEIGNETEFVMYPDIINTVYANIFEMDTDDINFGNTDSAVISGPDVTLADESFSLFDMPFGFDAGFLDYLRVAYDNEGRTIQVIASTGLPKALNGTDKKFNKQTKEWNETYNKLKSMYESEDFSDWGKIFSEQNTSSLMDNLDTKTSGYVFMQLKITDNGIVFDEGGGMLAVNVSTSTSKPIPAAPYIYVKFAASVDASANFKFTATNVGYSDTQIDPVIDLRLAFAPTLGLGLGLDGYIAAEAGINGEIAGTLEIPFLSMEESLTLEANIGYYIKLTLLAFEANFGATLNEWQLWPVIDENAVSAANLASLEDMEVVERNYISLKSSAPDSSIIKSSVYPYGKVKTAALSDGRVLVVWLDDDSSRATINKTAVYYSVIEDGVMSEPEQIYDDGTADYDFDLCVYNDTAAIAWQNSGSALSGSADLSDVAESINIVSSVFDGSDWSEPLSITNDTNYEYSPSIYYDGSTQYIIWTQNDVNTAAPGLEEAVESIYRAYVNSSGSITKTTMASDIGLVYESAVGVGGKIAYIYDSDGDISTTEKSLYYSSSVYYTDEAFISGLYRDDSGTIRYTYNGTAYPISENTYFDGDESTENIMYLTNDNGTSAVIYEVVDGFASEIYGRYNLGYGWSDQVQITDLGSKLRSWNGELNDDNTITVTAIAAEINVSGSDVSETTRLVRTSYEPDESITTEDTAIENVSIDSSVVRGETAEISFDVVNKTNSSLTSYTVAFTGETAGVIDEKSYTTSIAAQDRATITAYVTVPDDFVRQNVTVSLSTSAANGFEDNDSVTVEMGDDYITAELDGSDAASTGAMELTVTNNGCTDLTDIAISVEDDYENQLLSTSLSSLAAGEEKTYSIAVNSAYLSFGSIYDSYGVMAAVTAAGTNGTVTASDAYRARAEAVSTITADTGTSVVLKAGESITPQIEILNADTAVDATLYTASDNESVAVTDNGTITAVGVGTANVAYMPLGTSYSYIIGVEVYNPGDVDCNGVVDRLDAVLVLKYIADITEFDSVQLAAADYNNDGYVNMIDVTEILKAE